jgi:hypothetical protein
MSVDFYYSASWTGTTIVCAPTPPSTTPPTTSTTTTAKIGTVQWDGCIHAITEVLRSFNITVSDVSMSTATTSKTGTLTNPTPAPVTGADVLRALLTTARTVGVTGTTSVGIESLNATPYTALQLKYTDIAVNGVQASGSFSVSSHSSETYVNVNRASFVILPQSVKARSIVIVITVGGVKVTIIVRW